MRLYDVRCSDYTTIFLSIAPLYSQKQLIYLMLAISLGLNGVTLN
ncbi:hypothetical protein SAMN02745781_01592 [Vibrio gazogenes DSM 21264]|uniref:Uncharacterized protein n=1 Tax=Vibrio gazogenes DSM 21264 = NBRC 103151 TaxID=1123492 RepID=A0A1M4ZFK2_VIBGA|nr:hypothetical protein SAMN02745781_01592 [Vibrio gazogenes DSM 21264] [Vibrio gazogenes DSM 21264 = NBRC 103151]SJN53434.1 hypothetical protein BQ6471_00443 [Vibrio gazogenes]